MSAPVNLDAVFEPTAPLPQRLPWPDLGCDRDEPCEKPQLLPDDGIYIDIGDSPAIELPTEPPGSENEYPWLGQEDQSSGSEEDFQVHDPVLSSKRTHSYVFNKPSAPAKRRHMVDYVTVLPPVSGVPSEEIEGILLPKKSKLKKNTIIINDRRALAPEIRSLLSLDLIRKIGKLKDDDAGLEADKAPNSANTESQHQTLMTLDGAPDLEVLNSSWVDDTGDDSSPVTPVFDVTGVPRNDENEGLMQALDFHKSFKMLKNKSAVQFHDLVPYSDGKAVASVKFLALLTLATMGCLEIDQDQEEHLGFIGSVAGASFWLP